MSYLLMCAMLKAWIMQQQDHSLTEYILRIHVRGTIVQDMALVALTGFGGVNSVPVT